MIDVVLIVAGELTPGVAVVLTGRESVAVVRPGLMAVSAGAGWTSLQLQQSPELSVLTA